MEKAMNVFGTAATIFEIGAMFCRTFNRSIVLVKKMKEGKN